MLGLIWNVYQSTDFSHNTYIYRYIHLYIYRYTEEKPHLKNFGTVSCRLKPVRHARPWELLVDIFLSHVLVVTYVSNSVPFPDPATRQSSLVLHLPGGGISATGDQQIYSQAVHGQKGRTARLLD